MTAGADPHELVEVRILHIPLDVHRITAEHQDGLQREFAMIAETADRESVPVRLFALIDELNASFQAFGAGAQAQLEEAVEQGATTIDLVYRIPAAVSVGAQRLVDMLDEVDDFCRRGEDLLTLVSPPVVVAYREWFLGEFIRQVEGEPPQPWENPAAD